jgi:hypothetical protein
MKTLSNTKKIDCHIQNKYVFYYRQERLLQRATINEFQSKRSIQ